MIIIYHNDNKVTSVWHKQDKRFLSFKRTSVAQVLFDTAASYPSSVIIWCHDSQKENLDLSNILEIFHHKKIIASYRPGMSNYLPDAIGYVESSPFIKVNKRVQFPTWQMSSTVGGVHANLLNILSKEIVHDTDFDFFLNSFAKLAMPLGVLCYSEPRLLLTGSNVVSKSQSVNATTFKLFRFVKQHYKIRWIFLLFVDLLLYEKRFPFFSFVFALFYRKRHLNIHLLDAIELQSSLVTHSSQTVDVLIPTIGRKSYLFDVLQDLKKQYLPVKNVIIVEQNPTEGSVSELDYINSEIWPFQIKHIFTHQAGACNARNVALEHLESDWVFFADDDIRIDKGFLAAFFEQSNKLALSAVTFRCYQKNEPMVFPYLFQWGTFGSGCSIVKREAVKGCRFEKGYEFGFGEDADFGMQIRNKGIDVIYLPYPQILHLKAPIGGFRTKPALSWHSDAVQPKPSPTVMLYNLLHKTPEQTAGYKTTLFIKYYKLQSVKNPIRYYTSFQKRWKRSLYWAEQLRGDMV